MVPALPAPELPFIDEHAVEVTAPAERAWDAVCHVVSGSFQGRSRTLFARVLGATEIDAQGDAGMPGSMIAGFRVARAAPPVELVLEGEHRFSRYALIFHLEALAGNRTRVRAGTRAAFPGLRGRAYRALVIGTRGHVLVVRRLLLAIKRRAESEFLETSSGGP